MTPILIRKATITLLVPSLGLASREWSPEVVYMYPTSNFGKKEKHPSSSCNITTILNGSEISNMKIVCISVQRFILLLMRRFFFLDSLTAQPEMIIVRISSHLYLQILS